MTDKYGSDKKTVYIFTDGACSGNPGPGGWGAVMRCGGREAEYSGGEINTTNNRMELTAVIFALSELKYPCRVIAQTDSRYVTDGIMKGWAASWKRNGWVKSDKKPALNADLWEELLRLCEVHDVTFAWIKGHSGHPENERCDDLAVKARELVRARAGLSGNP
ncbi:MAG: ribonuclease HI [Oscillospiraceae bacterium]|jgi:ribonuclease HI|nr:ribonuclease HI [Oscillospiraceae bacterium]